MLDTHLADKTYLLGERYCVVDKTLAIVLGFAKNVGQDLLVNKNLARFHQEVTARPAFSE